MVETCIDAEQPRQPLVAVSKEPGTAECCRSVLPVGPLHFLTSSMFAEAQQHDGHGFVAQTKELQTWFDVGHGATCLR